MALQGNIDSFSVVDVLRLLGSSGKSGRLVVDGDRGSGSLWLADGLVITGTTTRTGAAPIAAPPSEVLFDLLRFVDGAFVFEADVAPSELARTDASPAVDVESMIIESQDALHEWDEIVAVVPSLRTEVGLVLDLATDSIEIDRRSWSGVVAIAAGVAATGDRTTVGAVAELAGLSELPAMRLVRDLVAIGVVEVGTTLAEQPRYEPAFEHAPFESAPFETAAFEPASFEPASFEPASFEPVTASFDPPAYEPADIDLPPPSGEPVGSIADPVMVPTAEPAADEAPVAPAPIGNIGAVPGGDGSDAFEPFAPFDPFGTAAAEAAAAAAATTAAAEPEPAPAHAPAPPSDSFFATEAPATTGTTDGDVLSAEEEAAQQAEFARQLAMLSPRAAEAVASAEAGPSTEDEERARVARFLGSV